MDWKSLEGLKFRGGHGDTEYRLGVRRGFGGFGSVFEATRSQSGQPDARVAVKIFLVEEEEEDENGKIVFVLDHAGLTRKLNELMTVAAERHDCIVATPRHGVGSVDLRGRHGVFMEMELAECDLLKRMSSGRMSVDEVRKLAVDICRGLAFLHDRPNPIVHRDLKPGNILWFAGQKRWKLGDLGLARELSQPGQLTRTAQIGTPIYMSPEAFKSEVGPASDMWALGVIIAELLTGRVPFGHGVSEVYQVMYQILEGRPDFGGTRLPPPFDRIVDECLSKEWKKRVSAGQVLDMLGEQSAAARANVGAVVNKSPAVAPSSARYTPGQIIRATLRDGSAAPELCAIPPGVFDMGDLSGKGLEDQRPVVHSVKIDYWYGLGRFAVTCDEYGLYVKSRNIRTNSCHERASGQFPVTHVSWNDAQDYINWLNKLNGFSFDCKHRWRLPTESEWEYACRAGSRTEFWWGDQISTSKDNYGGNYDDKGETGRCRKEIVAANRFQHNKWGLYQIIGNVWEWCEDAYLSESYEAYNWVYPQAVTPQHADKRHYTGQRVKRGGTWASSPNRTRSAHRSALPPDAHTNRTGFRLARTLP
ncbi:bifunctional serine/threonine-protein kinase/formylglycine-generating enzyme family protein [Magnetospirillum sp. 15-1]|uniref:bifunctional serine/threonine-protein kinase/formylglycine-generating enzyme family protein n=1 Tax=Magnetospirillum sp. 15-1 TaxID=1979370 RepID=UPI000BBCD2E9|nr:bifunctional serine/threonine-protein kinase/formylglycine-generating enzyme family protein [Magnetospirillum sp. 15-1]